MQISMNSMKGKNKLDLGQRNKIVGKVLTLQSVNPGLILAPHMVLPATPKVILNHRVRNKL